MTDDRGQERQFDELVARYRTAIHQYYDYTRNPDSQGRGSTVAFELGYIFTDAEAALSADPNDPLGYEAFQGACDRIREACFAPKTTGDEPCP